MPSVAQYACRCLNVRIAASSSPAPPPSYDSPSPDPAYTPLFVNDDGITITHPQVTVRLTTKGQLIAGTSRCTRFTMLTCLLCNLAVYRVAQTISSEVEGNETILLPTEEWVEHEILKSPTGWIEVHKDCIVGNSIQEAEASSLYARAFSLLLPDPSSPPPSPPTPSYADEDNSSNATSLNDEPAPSYLDLRPLFLPPPFTSSHPIFVLLSSLATKKSQEIRTAAEQRIADFVKSEAAGVEQQEKTLKRQVELLWRDFRTHLQAVPSERSQRVSAAALSPSRNREIGFSSSHEMPLPVVSSPSVTIRNFVPVPISAALSPPHRTSSSPKVSALSASLATSRFHHPRENRLHDSTSPETDSSDETTSSRTPSSQSGSSTLVYPPPVVADSNVLQYKRNIDDTINTAASYKLFVDIDRDRARYQEARKKVEMASKALQEGGPSQAISTSNTNGDKKPKKNGETEPSAETSLAAPETTPSRGRDKGKRKVTFDVEPAVVTIDGDEKAEDEAGEMLFELENSTPRPASDKSPPTQHNTLPLIEQPVARPNRPRNTKPQNNSKVIEAFTSLRPASLPNPSHIRPLRSPPGVDSSQRFIPSLRKAPARSDSPQKVVTSPNQDESSTSTPPTNDSDANGPKPAVVDTPGQRGSKMSDSKAWQTFARRQDTKESSEHGQILEGDEDNSNSPGQGFTLPSRETVILNGTHNHSVDNTFVGSLPMKIRNRQQPVPPLSLASYLPPSAIPLEEPPSPIHKEQSSDKVRKALYAERDRERLIDPGPLDFVIEEDEEEQDELAVAEPASEDAGEKARKQALSILKARSELPEEGMWRSLA